ncbi:SDR family NAD(P)-dependent oxidoreductase [Novosphingobium cyanobacteriorum]|uniref:SDR family oxidoreductase n=1 Tax=Novosphingobium cyanobacteriorum TaxID=3024215 RepID=A0ABT6CFW5_9SPHN|nr:SDR family NAD(P)-dependent oxidoreductase [Novosphingobium cyanobacteriorum]MDF8332208.1 SDR family oxidoreductase [Novosphingobium cyanobacteriorum]
MSTIMSGFSFDLSDRTVLVTGASSGLGARFSKILATSGARVVLAARRTTLIDQLAERIRADGGRAVAVAMDVADEESTKAAYDAAEAAFGTVDTVIGNAGVNIEALAVDIEADMLDAIHSVNVRGLFLTLREGARRLIAAGSKDMQNGRMVIISSITAQSISPGTAPYSASKAAALQLGRVLSRDWANKGININMILPGYILTDINSDWFATPGGEKQRLGWPRRRLMDEDALDGLLLYLCSDASRFVTGAAFTVDDGQSL